MDVSDWVQNLAGIPDGRAEIMLHLFGGLYLTVGGTRAEIPEGSKRMLAFVALREGPVARRHAAGTLWPVGDDARAAGNLRSALWRLNRADARLITADKSSLALGETVLVDFHVISGWASRLITGSLRESDLVVGCRDLGSLDILPGWYDDWVLMNRERARQRLLHALEVLSAVLVQRGRCAEAIDAAMLAVGSEPLRETAQLRLIEAYIAEGNWVEGRRRFDAYRHLVLSELGVEPHPYMSDLVRNPCAPGATANVRPTVSPTVASPYGRIGTAERPRPPRAAAGC